MEYTYQTERTCVEFLGGGCPGNLQAVPRLVEGMKVSEIEEKLGGINCSGRGTSCADQLAKAVRKAYEESKQTL